jgi:RNA polymerase sigma factor (sigma-70 family)
VSDSVFGSVTGWVRDLENGSHDALVALWDRYYNALTKRADKKLSWHAGTMVDGEDVASTVLTRLAENAQREERKGRIQDRQGLWLFMMAILKTVVIDLKRRNYSVKRGRGKVHSLTDFSDTTQEGKRILDIIDGTPNHERLVMLRDSINYLLKDTIKVELTRTVARLKLEGYTNTEIADQIGMEPKTVRRKLKRIQNLWARDLGITSSDDDSDADDAE